MYQLQERADEVAILDKGRTGDYVIPLATLKDEYGGVSHIIKDDGCFVLINKTVTGGFVMVHHWYPEAAAALVELMDDGSSASEGYWADDDEEEGAAA